MTSDRWIGFESLPIEVQSLGRRRVMNLSTRHFYPEYRRYPTKTSPPQWLESHWLCFLRRHRRNESDILAAAAARIDLLEEMFDGEPNLRPGDVP